MNWSASDIPNLNGKRYLITGGNSGLGLATAKQLVRHDADVTLTVRSAEKGERAINESGAARWIELDVADLSSVREVAKNLTEKFDVVILNAGIMATPFAKSVDGFEMQMATNYLGHFALAGLLRHQINERLITVSSIAHRMGSFGKGSKEEIRAKALGEGSYSPWLAYGATKLADLVFVNQLERRRLQGKESFTSISIHPGWAHTNLFGSGKLVNVVGSVLAQSAEEGALSTLFAATAPNVKGASFIGPKKFGGLRGAPEYTHGNATSYRQQLGINLWDVSEELTGVSWEN